ncbi:MAG: helix-turn-helix transcriptional regulator [Anaerorhabdus sp.]|uniref:helix-turn-helix transcriptional regulator n=1 Tax=Anaerorhabdus sp. TaxID=1872524 RepID=UPI003A886C6E
MGNTFTLKSLRVNAGLKIEFVAKYIGKTKQTIINWENGKSVPNSLELNKLCELYKVNSDIIFLGDKLSFREHYERFII